MGKCCPRCWLVSRFPIRGQRRRHFKARSAPRYYPIPISRHHACGYKFQTSGLCCFDKRERQRHSSTELTHERSFSKTPLALLESSHRPQEIDTSKGRPIHVREIELAEHTLP